MEVSLPFYFELKEQFTFLSAASAFVGLATMIVLPVPGYIAKKIQDVQVQRMVLSYIMCLLFFLDLHSFQILQS
jgi:hypothetical protein